MKVFLFPFCLSLFAKVLLKFSFLTDFQKKSTDGKTAYSLVCLYSFLASFT